MNVKTNMFFCWVHGVKDVTCVIIYGLDQNIDSYGKEKKQILQKHELPVEYKDLSLNQLSMIYPYKEVTNET